MRGGRREGRRGRVINEVAWSPPDGNRWRGDVEGSVGTGGVREPASWRRLELGKIRDERHGQLLHAYVRLLGELWAGVGLLAVNPDGRASARAATSILRQLSSLRSVLDCRLERRARRVGGGRG